MTDQRVETRVSVVGEGEIGFQEYFVGRHHDVPIDGVRFEGVEDARPAPGVLEALRGADVVVVAPSNPVVSIGPVLAVPGVREVLEGRRASVVAVSPIIAGAALKGPADRMLRELGGEASVVEVARRYREHRRVARGRQRRRGVGGGRRRRGRQLCRDAHGDALPRDRRCAGRHGARRRVSVLARAAGRGPGRGRAALPRPAGITPPSSTRPRRSPTSRTIKGASAHPASMAPTMTASKRPKTRAITAAGTACWSLVAASTSVTMLAAPARSTSSTAGARLTHGHEQGDRHPATERGHREHGAGPPRPAQAAGGQHTGQAADAERGREHPVPAGARAQVGGEQEEGHQRAAVDEVRRGHEQHGRQRIARASDRPHAGRHLTVELLGAGGRGSG